MIQPRPVTHLPAGGAVVKLGKKTVRLTAALAAREIEVGEPGPAQRHLLTRYQTANEQDREQLRAMWAVALMRANAVSWDQIGQALMLPDPSKYQSSELWRDVYEAAEEASLGEAASDAIACLRKLTRSKSHHVRALAANALLQARAKQWKARTEDTRHVLLENQLDPQTAELVEQIKRFQPDVLRALLAQPAIVELTSGPPPGLPALIKLDRSQPASGTEG